MAYSETNTRNEATTGYEGVESKIWSESSVGERGTEGRMEKGESE